MTDEAVARVRAWLLDRGVNQEEIDRAIEADQLHLLVVDRSVVPEEPVYTGHEISVLAGMPADDIERLWRALGFPAVDATDRVFTERDLQAVTSTHGLLYLGLSNPDAMLQLATMDVAIGFADMVGFTVLSQQLSEGALAEVVGRFEALAYDTISASGGRVVKMIGDEVMFSVPDVAAAASIALGLSAAYAADEMLSEVRVGLACGPVLLRDGDCFGPAVNLASRIVNIAAPGSVIVSDEVHSVLEGDDQFAWKSIRPRYLKDIGRVPLWVLNRPGHEHDRRNPWWLLRDTVRERVERAHAVGKEVLTAHSELDL